MLVVGSPLGRLRVPRYGLFLSTSRPNIEPIALLWPELFQFR